MPKCVVHKELMPPQHHHAVQLLPTFSFFFCAAVSAVSAVLCCQCCQCCQCCPGSSASESAMPLGPASPAAAAAAAVAAAPAAGPPSVVVGSTDSMTSRSHSSMPGSSVPTATRLALHQATDPLATVRLGARLRCANQRRLLEHKLTAPHTCCDACKHWWCTGCAILCTAAARSHPFDTSSALAARSGRSPAMRRTTGMLAAQCRGGCRRSPPHQRLPPRKPTPPGC